jgi:hypothetical protein
MVKVTVRAGVRVRVRVGVRVEVRVRVISDLNSVQVRIHI